MGELVLQDEINIIRADGMDPRCNLASGVNALQGLANDLGPRKLACPILPRFPVVEGEANRQR